VDVAKTENPAQPRRRNLGSNDWLRHFTIYGKVAGAGLVWAGKIFGDVISGDFRNPVLMFDSYTDECMKRNFREGTASYSAWDSNQEGWGL